MTPAQVHFPIIVEQIRKIHESEAQVLRGAAELQNLLEAALHLPGAFHYCRGLLLPRFTVDRAAAREGVSRSAFVVAAAVEKAERIIADEATTRVPPRFFDDLLAALDEATPAPA